MPPERQRQLLAGLVVVLAVLGVWQYMGSSPAPLATVAARRTETAVVVPLPVDVALDALEGARLGPDDGGRNPFVFGMRQAALPDTGDAACGHAPSGHVGAWAHDGATGPPPLPPIPFKFIGLVEGASSAKRIAVLSDSQGLVAHGTEGTIIDGRFRILSIGAESIDIAYVDGRGRQTLRLSGQ